MGYQIHRWYDLNIHLTVLETVALPIKLHPHKMVACDGLEPSTQRV